MVMAIAEDMKKLTENIIISNDVRLKAVGGLVKDTHKMLKEFHTEHKNMSAEQAKSLLDFARGLRKDVENMLNGFDKNHKQMSKEQAKSLADFVTNMASDVSSMLSTSEKARGKMSKELADRLAKEIKDIQSQVENLLDEADKLMSEYSSDMAQAKKAWTDMSATLTKARRAGFGIDAGEKVTTVRQATRKTQGKQKAPAKNAKSKSVKRKTHAHV